MIKTLLKSAVAPWVELAALRTENALLREENAMLREENARLREENALLRAQVAMLTERIAELERQLGLNSSNSSKPPSSDGLRKKPSPQSLRENGSRKAGGQKGHSGATLRQIENPNVVITHKVDECPHCDTYLGQIAAIRVKKRQVFDIPEPKVVVTEHQAEIKVCFGCRREIAAEFPEGINAPVQYGPRCRTLSIYLQHQQFIPEDRLSDVFADVFGLPISSATVAKMGKDFAAQLAPMEQGLLRFLEATRVKCADETGFRIGGQTKWLHVLCNDKATHYRAMAKRGAMPEGLSGIIVHDHFKSYYGLSGVEHGLCNAHHLRELQALIEIEREAWARKMKRLLRFVGKLAQKGGCSTRLMDRVLVLYEKILVEGLEFHSAQPLLQKGARGRQKRRIGHNLLLRLSERKADVLRCLSDPLVPFTNNQAEQDIRMMKVKQKVSGGFRTDKGADEFCRIRSFLSTAAKQGLNRLQAISLAMDGNFVFTFT